MIYNCMAQILDEQSTLKAMRLNPQWHQEGMISHAASLIVELVAAEVPPLQPDVTFSSYSLPLAL